VRSFFLGALLMFLASAVLAGSPMSARSVLNSVTSIGATETLHRIYEDEPQWSALLSHIATGKSAWLDVAKRLRAVSDGGSSEQLDLAVGEALEHRPINVLTLAIPDFRLEVVCGGPDVDDQRFDSYDLSIAAINRRESQLRALREPAIARARDSCISELEKAKAGIAHFYERDK
jgi:hypothetical protein